MLQRIEQSFRETYQNILLTGESLKEAWPYIKYGLKK